mgnify:CR=1 FL=1
MRCLKVVNTIKVNEDIRFKVSANLSTDFIDLTVTSKYELKEERIIITDSSGKNYGITYPYDSNHIQRIGIADLQTGLYLIYIILKGEILISQKFVVHK